MAVSVCGIQPESMCARIPRPGFIPLHGCLSDGTVILRGTDASSNASGDRFFGYKLVRLDGTVVRQLGELPVEMYAGPIQREPSIVPNGDELVVGDAKTYEVRVQSMTGRVRRILRVTEGPRRITDDEWRKGVESMVPLGTPELKRALLVARIMARRRPATLPPYRRVRVDPARRIWIGDYQNPRLWAVFDSSGYYWAVWNCFAKAIRSSATCWGRGRRHHSPEA